MSWWFSFIGRRGEALFISIIIIKTNVDNNNNNNYINKNNNNNNNNYKLSIVPISSKENELGDAHSTGVGETHSPCTMESSSTNDQMDQKTKLCHLMT